MKVQLALLVVFVGCVLECSDAALVRAWGEPHVWAYRQPYQVTCGAAGFQTYLDNEFMTIMAFNWQRSASSPWTVMTQIFITLKNPADGSVIAVYYAPDSTSPAPTTFLFPPSTTSVSSPSTPVNQLVRIFASGSTVVIRHYRALTAIVLNGKRGNIFLSMNVYMPDVLAEVSSGILINGCPPGEVIAIPSPGRRRRQVGRFPVEESAPEEPRPDTEECAKFGELQGACEYDARFLGIEFALEAARATAEGRDLAIRHGREMADNHDERAPQ